MNGADVRLYYIKVAAVFYVAWVTIFILEGLYAVTLRTYDPTSWLDRSIPVVSEFAFIYVSCYLFPLILVVITLDWHRFNMALLAIAICTLVAFIGHLAYPVAFTRPLLGQSLSDRFVAFIYDNDFKPGAQNFPSLHVAIAWIVAFSSRGQGLSKPVEWGITLYAMLIMVSTILIKQHLVIDLIGGTVLAFMVWPLVKQSYIRAIPEGGEPLAALKIMFKTLAPLFAVLLLCLVGIIAANELR